METLRLTRHLHTTNHREPPQQVSLADLARRYPTVDALFVEDHGRFQPPSHPNDLDPGPMILPGAEWATPIHPPGRPPNRHHVGLLGVDAFEQSQLQIQGYDAPALMRQKVHSAGGALVLNHPEYPYIDTQPSAAALDYTLPLEEARAFDAVELFNDVGFRGSQPAEVLKWVERVFWQRGLYPAMVGGQDDHGPSPVAKEPTYTLAAVRERSESGLLEAIRSSRTFVSKALEAELSLQLDGQPLWERNTPISPGTHAFTALVRGLPPGAVVEVVRRGEVLARTVASAGEAAFNLSLNLEKTDQADYIYLRAWSEPGQLHTVSSAVPFDR